MDTTRRMMTLLPLAGLLPALAPAAVAPAVLPLWPEGVPAATRPDAPAARGDLGAERGDASGSIANVSQPTLTVVPPAVDRPNGTAVVICPGGAYTILAIDKEGHTIARWFNERGVTAFVLRSRLKDYKQPSPVLDAQQAIRVVRERASEWNVDP